METTKENSTQVILGLNWHEDTPMIRFRIGSEATLSNAPALNSKLHYRITPESKRFCLGHIAMTDGGSTYKGCAGKPQKGRKCPKCTSADARYAANLHHAHIKNMADLPSEFQRHMEQPNYLYLASFGDGSMKVGTTTSHRKERRLQEQGALWAIVLAKTLDGFAVRRLEDLVTTELSIQQAVSTKKKITGLLHPIERKQAKENLDLARKEVEELLLSVENITCDIVGIEWENKALKSETWKNVHLYPRDLSSGAHLLRIVDVIGRIGALVPEDSSDVFIADLDTLFGIELEIGSFPTEDLLIQDALF